MFKKSFTIALAVVLAFASIAACAIPSTAKRIGYDVDSYLYELAHGYFPGTIDNVYQIFDDNGVMVAQVSGQYAYDAFGLAATSPVDLKNPWVSKEYPNNEYADVYVNGQRLECLNGLFPTGRFGLAAGVKYRNVDFMWEAAAPHRIYSKTQAYLFVDGAAQWYSNGSYPVQYTGRNAQVKAERVYYGFAGYKVTGADAVALMPKEIKENWVGAEVFGAIEGLTSADLEYKKAEPAVYDVTEFANDIKIPKSYDIKLVGPGFDAEGNMIPDAKTIIGSDLTTCDPANLGVADVIGVVRDTNGKIKYADITWTNAWTDPTFPHYKNKYPHSDYLFLTVDGVVMDGRMIAPGVYRPAIAKRIVYNCEHCGYAHAAGVHSHPYASATTVEIDSNAKAAQ